jgi:hypothetical protein
MHYDGMGSVNINVQVFGHKHWTVFHPRFASVFEATPVFEAPMAPPYIPGTTKHPRECTSNPGYQEVVGHEAELAPGDAIFVPAYWMHWVVYGPEPSASCNFWWQPETVPMTGASAAASLVNAVLTIYRRKMPGATLIEISQALNQLPAEARELLRDIERTLTWETRLMESPTMFLGLRKGVDAAGNLQLAAIPAYAERFEKTDK